MTWNEAILESEMFSGLEKMLFHLLCDWGTSPAARRKAAGVLQKSERHVLRMFKKMAALFDDCGNPREDVAAALLDMDGQNRTPMSKSGHLCPKSDAHVQNQTSMSTSDTHVQNRTPMSIPSTHARTFSKELSTSPKGDVDAVPGTTYPSLESAPSGASSPPAATSSSEENPKEYLQWLGDQRIPLLPFAEDFDAVALVKRWREKVPCNLWGRYAPFAGRVFELIHAHPQWASQDRTPMDQLERLVDLATKHRPGRNRLATEPADLLRKTESGKARWQAILLFEEGAAETPKSSYGSRAAQPAQRGYVPRRPDPSRYGANTRLAEWAQRGRRKLETAQ